MENKFSWTQEFRRSWDESQIEEKTRPMATMNATINGRRNIIRNLHVVIDTSASIEKSDYLPSIRSEIAKILPNFLNKFNEYNPLSQLTFMTCKEVVEKYSKSFDANLMLNIIGSGEFSLLNSIKGSIEIIKTTKFNKECLIIISSLNTIDSGSYEDVLSFLKKQNIKINIISICGEVTLFKKLSNATGGLFFVPVNRDHFENIINSFTQPLDSSDQMNTLVKYGFPETIIKKGLCNCHLNICSNLKECPQCKSFVCTLPIQCPVCDLQLVSPLNISKSSYYIYPINEMIKSSGKSCKCCSKNGSFECQKCNSVYCADCHDFVIQYLNFCVYCDNSDHN